MQTMMYDPHEEKADKGEGFPGAKIRGWTMRQNKAPDEGYCENKNCRHCPGLLLIEGNTCPACLQPLKIVKRGRRSADGTLEFIAKKASFPTEDIALKLFYDFDHTARRFNSALGATVRVYEMQFDDLTGKGSARFDVIGEPVCTMLV